MESDEAADGYGGAWRGKVATPKMGGISGVWDLGHGETTGSDG